MFIGNPKTTLPTDTRAFAAETAAIPGEINLRVTAAAAKQNLFRAGADTVTASIAQMNKGLFRYCPRWTAGYRSGWRATSQQLKFIASHRCSAVFRLYSNKGTKCGIGFHLQKGRSAFHGGC
jgi:hypothetical protein